MSGAAFLGVLLGTWALAFLAMPRGRECYVRAAVIATVVTFAVDLLL